MTPAAVPVGHLTFDGLRPELLEGCAPQIDADHGDPVLPRLLDRAPDAHVVASTPASGRRVVRKL